MDDENKQIEPHDKLVGGSILTITFCYFVIGLFWPLLIFWDAIPDALLLAQINSITVFAFLISYFQYAGTFRGDRRATSIVIWLQILGTIFCLTYLTAYLWQFDFHHPWWPFRLKPIAYSIGFAAAFAAMAILNFRWLKELSDPGNEFLEDNPSLIASDYALMWVVGFGAGSFVMCSGYTVI